MKYLDNLIDRLMEKCSGIKAPSLLSINCETGVLTWQDNSANESNFSIERSADDYVFAQIATVSADIVTYTDSARDTSLTYYYRVRAYNGMGYSAYSNVVICQGVASTTVKYGLLYNYPAVVDVRNIAATGFSVPAYDDWKTLIFYLDPDAYEEIGEDYAVLSSEVVGGMLKEIGTEYWESTNEGASNSVGFNLRGAGVRDGDGTFNNLKVSSYLLGVSSTGDYLSSDIYAINSLVWVSSDLIAYEINFKIGGSIRLVRPATVAEQLLPDGTVCDNYVGNDGKEYPTVKIGTQVWLACNLAETKFRTGEDIPEVTNNAEWAALTTSGMCAQNNDHTNVFI